MNLRNTRRAVILASALSAGLPVVAAAQAPAPTPRAPAPSAKAAAPSAKAAVPSAQAPAPATKAPAPSAPTIPVNAWPRQINLTKAAVLVYQPQVSGWTDNRIEFRSALAIKPTGAREETFGVIFVTASTHVDKVARTVTFDDLRITKSNFPTLPDRGAAYAAELQKAIASGVRTMSLDRVKASLAAAGIKPSPVAVQNTPPKVFVSNSPAILVPIDGAPVMKPVPDSGEFQRVINTRALIVKAASEPQFFMHVYDGWLMSLSMDGPWTQPFIPPSGIDALAKRIAATGVVDLLDGGAGANPKPSLAQGIPAIFTSQVPAELIVFKDKPDFAPIAGTQLRVATNTLSDVLQDAASNDYYVLLAGRWFRSAALTGPWTFVASNALPPDFARIPASSPAGVVLPTVAGTPQAIEAVIENLIPQTATVSLKNGPKFTPVFDGAPKFAAIPGTSLSHAANASVPVIQVAADAYYAVTAGVWFSATQPTGPWTIATSVPPAVYTIPPSSPLFYVTFVRIYGATPDAVREGYTPGYLGAMVEPTGTVVYGTGYGYAPWIGNAWYAAPATYGIAATPVYNAAVGFTYGFAMSLATAAWTEPYLGGAHFHPGYWSNYPCCASTSANVYRIWGSGAASKSRAAVAGGAAKGKDANAAANVAAGTATTTTSANSGQSGTGAPVVASPSAKAGAPSTSSAGPTVRGFDRTANALPTAAAGNLSASAANRNPANPPAPASDAGGISANEYYASLGQTNTWKPDSVANNHYADGGGNVYRKAGNSWQQQSPNGWTDAPVAPPAVDAEASARDRAAQAAEQAGSYSMSNADRFSGNPDDGWSRQDSGDAGYSRTLGGSGGIGAEAYNYNQAVLHNEITMWNDAVTDGGVVYYGGLGWGGRFGVVVGP